VVQELGHQVARGRSPGRCDVGGRRGDRAGRPFAWRAQGIAPVPVVAFACL